MLKKIISILLTCSVFWVCGNFVKAENKFMSPFKKPFSMFSDKKKPTIENKTIENLNIKVEKVEKVEKKQQKPIIVFDPKNILGITYAENVIEKAEFYIEESDFQLAGEALIVIEDWIYDATEYHTDLFKTLKKLDNSEVQADIERNLAIKFAVLRDKSIFLRSQILLENGQKKEAVEKLVEVVRSQPNTDLGFKAYKLLQDAGFTYKIEFIEPEVEIVE